MDIDNTFWPLLDEPRREDMEPSEGDDKDLIWVYGMGVQVGHSLMQPLVVFLLRLV